MRSSVENDRGFSLVEVLVAVALLSIAVVGGFRALNHGLLTAGSDRDRLLAELVARNRAEELRAGLSSLPESVQMAGRTWGIETVRQRTSGGFDEITVRAIGPEAAGAVTTWLPVAR